MRLAWGICALIALACVPGTGGRGSPAPAPEPAVAQALLREVRQLTFVGRRSGEGYFSADGKRLVFQSEREPGNPFYQIYSLDLETGEVARLSPGQGQTTCGFFHPSGRKALFSSTHLDPGARAKQERELAERAAGTQRRYAWDFDPAYDIFEVDVAGPGRGLRRLTRAAGYDAEASYAPDGRSIVFASNRHAHGKQASAAERELLERDPAALVEIYRMNADGSNVQRLTQAAGYDGGPFFSPDGARIVFRRFSDDGATAEIYSMDAAGGDVRPLTRVGALSWAPFYHPSGEYLVFSTNLHGYDNFELYLVDAQGNAPPVRVTQSDGFDGLAVFSPDGETIAWTSARAPGGRSQIFAARWDHEGARRLLGLDKVPGATHAVLRPRATEPAIEPADLRAHVEALASDAADGRLTGTEGERLATDYVARVFESLGLAPAASDGGYFQPFEFTAGVSLGPENRLVVWREGEPQPAAEPLDRSWRPLAFSRTGPAPAAEVVFAGYGIVAPGTGVESGGFAAYDSYAGLEVAGKWVLVLRHVPENVSPELRTHLRRYAPLRYKAMLARDRGALGILLASGPREPARESLVPLGHDASVGRTSLLALSIDDELARRLLAVAGRSLDDLQGELDAGGPVPGFALRGLELEAHVDLVQEKRTGRNVVARLRSGAPKGRAPVVIGAHVDHLGRGLGAETLARPEERGQVHYGADDNASGVAAVLEIAQSLAGEAKAGRFAPRRDVLFVAWSGEELGLLGSAAFVEGLPDVAPAGHDGASATASPAEPARPRAYAAYLNLDMVGRLNGELYLHGIGSSSVWMAEIESRNAPIGLPIAAQDESYLPTDATSFYLKGIPILSAFTGAHEEYHTPRDTPDRLDYEGLARITRLMGGVLRSQASRSEVPDFIQSERPVGLGLGLGPRAGLRAYLGTIPSYGRSEARGVKLAGVAKGGPAERAGLRSGDVIVELAGRKVENIYDYTYAIDALRIGEPAQVRVLRGAETLSLMLTPTPRE